MNKLKYTIRHKNINPMTVYIEPWAAEFVVPPESVLQVTISFTHADLLETETGTDYTTVWLWRGCTAEVSLDGKDQTPSFLSTPAPG
jgi:hypothetical protein